jgi:hypothetical protein
MANEFLTGFDGAMPPSEESGAMPLLGLREPVSQAPIVMPRKGGIPDGMLIRLQGSDKYAVIVGGIDNTRAWQLLPVDPQRKRALITLPDSINGNANAIQTLAVGNPAAGANFSSSPSPFNTFQLIGLSFTLTTAIAVASRVSSVSIGGLVLSPPVSQAASLAYTYNYILGASQAFVGTTVTVGLPAITLTAGALIASLIGNIQAADQISGITLYYISEVQPGIVIGPQPQVDNGVGYPLLQNDNLPPLEFTSKGALYGIASQAGVIQVAILVERYGDGTPVN